MNRWVLLAILVTSLPRLQTFAPLTSTDRLSAINVTGHHNPNALLNVDAPQFMTFSGGQSRAFTARLRFVGRR